MTHLKVSYKSYLHVQETFAKRNLRKSLGKVLHDTLASSTTKVAYWRFMDATVL